MKDFLVTLFCVPVVLVLSISACVAIVRAVCWVIEYVDEKDAERMARNGWEYHNGGWRKPIPSGK